VQSARGADRHSMSPRRVPPGATRDVGMKADNHESQQRAERRTSFHALERIAGRSLLGMAEPVRFG
jgi:hypothetical protein